LIFSGVVHRRWGLLSLGALGACGGRSNLGLAGDTSGGATANGGFAAFSGGVGVAGRSGGTGGRGDGGAGLGGNSAGRGGASSGTAGVTVGGGAAGTSGTGAGGSAGSRPNLSDDTTLFRLTVAEGYLAPRFDPRESTYWVTVPRGTETLTLEAIPNDSDAAVEVGGEPAVGPVDISTGDSGEGTIAIVVTAPSGARGTTYVHYGEELVQSSTYLKPSTTSEFATFGISVAVSGNTVAVGAYTENGVTDDDAFGPTGAVYVYVKDDDTWREEAHLTPSHRDLYDQFGYSVALFGDTLVVGAPGEDGSAAGSNGDETDNEAESAGAAYVFVRAGGAWVQQAYVKGAYPEPYAYLGASVALFGDTLVVGSPGQSGLDDGFGQPFAAGSATVLARDGTSWFEQQTLRAPNPGDQNQFGLSVALSRDTLAVGAPGEGSAPSGPPIPASGEAYVFARSGTSWTAQASIKSSFPRENAYFGTGVAVSGDLLVVGEPSALGVSSSESGGAALEAGAAHVYRRTGADWNPITALVPSNGGEAHHFGARVAVSGELVVVGAPGETGSSSGVNGDPARGGAYLSGAAYVFLRGATQWYQAEYLKATTSDPYDAFGISVSLADGKLAVGAYGEASNATGVNGDSTDDSVRGAGAAYVYELSE